MSELTDQEKLLMSMRWDGKEDLPAKTEAVEGSAPDTSSSWIKEKVEADPTVVPESKYEEHKKYMRQYSRQKWHSSRMEGLRHYGFCEKCSENRLEARYAVVDQDGERLKRSDSWVWLKVHGWPKQYRVFCMKCFKSGCAGPVKERDGYGSEGQLTLWPEK